MAIALALVSLMLGAALWGLWMDKNARKNLERDIESERSRWLLKAVEDERLKTDEEALDTLNDNFGEGGE